MLLSLLRIGRTAEEQIKYGNYTIPAKTPIQIPIYSIHHYEDYWPDQLKFNPERFYSFLLHFFDSLLYDCNECPHYARACNISLIALTFCY